MVMSACILGDTWENQEWRYKHIANGMYLLLLLVSQSTECHHKTWCSLLPLSRKLGDGNVHIISNLVESGSIEFLTHVLGSYAGVLGKDMFGYKTLEHARAINEHVMVLSHIVMHSPANLHIFIKAKCVAVLLETYLSFHLKFDFWYFDQPILLHVLLEIYLSFHLKFDFLYFDQPILLHGQFFLLDTTLYHVCVVLIEYASTSDGPRELQKTGVRLIPSSITTS